MQTVILKFTKVELINYDSRSNSLKLHVFFEENGKLNYIATDLHMTEDLQEFVKDFLSSIRTTYKKKYASNPIEDDILSGYVNIVLEEKEMGGMETKLINGLRKIRDSIRGFRSVKTADGYMDKYHRLRGQTIEF
jgi:hypothetical protein